MFQRFITTEQKNTRKLLKNFSLFFLFGCCFIFSSNVKADFSKCRNKELQEKVKRVAKEENVNSDELLSIIAHESRCNYFVIAWNLPGVPQKAKNKFFESIEEAKAFAEELITTKKYRVDVGIGQINYEANIKRKGWSLDEVLDPKTALNRVAQILKERGWGWYHSNNPFYAKKWRQLALNSLHQICSSSVFPTFSERNSLEKKKTSLSLREQRRRSVLWVYGEASLASSIHALEDLSSSREFYVPKKTTGSLIIYGNL